MLKPPTIESRAQIDELTRALDTMTIARPAAVQVLTIESGWYATLRLPRTRSAEDWSLIVMEKDGLLTQPGNFFEFEEDTDLVMSLIGPEAQFQSAIRDLFERVRAEA